MAYVEMYAEFCMRPEMLGSEESLSQVAPLGKVLSEMKELDLFVFRDALSVCPDLPLKWSGFDEFVHRFPTALDDSIMEVSEIFYSLTFGQHKLLSKDSWMYLITQRVFDLVRELPAQITHDADLAVLVLRTHASAKMADFSPEVQSSFAVGSAILRHTRIPTLLYKYFPPHARTVELAKLAINLEKNGRCTSDVFENDAPLEVLNSPVLHKMALQRGAALGLLPKSAHRDPETVWLAAGQKASAKKAMVCYPFNEQPEYVFRAVKADPEAYAYTCAEGLFEQCCEISPEVYQYGAPEERAEQGLAKRMMRARGENLQHYSGERSASVLLAAAAETPNAFKYMSRADERFFAKELKAAKAVSDGLTLVMAASKFGRRNVLERLTSDLLRQVLGYAGFNGEFEWVYLAHANRLAHKAELKREKEEERNKYVGHRLRKRRALF